MEKEALIHLLKKLLGTTFAFYVKAQNYHWNVTGVTFAQDHEFFGGIYDTVSGHVDLYAEHIRQLGAFAPGSLFRFSELSEVQDELAIPSSVQMYIRLANDNQIILKILYDTMKTAEEFNEVGLGKTLEETINYHEKLNWMLNSFTSSQ